jgi:hypothetical protein
MVMRRAFGTALGVVVGVAAIVLVLQLLGVNFIRMVTHDVDRGTVLGKLSAKADLITASRTERTTVERHVDCKTDIKVLHFTWPQELCGQLIRLNVDGKVDAVVNLDQVTKDGVTVDGDTVKVVLPEPRLNEPTVTNIQLLTDDRGLVDRTHDFFASDTEQSDATLSAGRKQLSKAAEGDSELHELARKKAESVIEGLLKSAGVKKVTVTFKSGNKPTG